MRYVILSSVILLMALSLAACDPTQGGTQSAEPETPPSSTIKVTITFSGLVAFAHDDQGKLHALLVNAREEQIVGNETIPPHVAFVSIYPSPSSAPTPQFAPWFLDNEEIGLTVNAPTGDHDEGSVLSLIPKLTDLHPSISEINPGVFADVPPTDLLIARVSLDKGTLKRHRKPRKLPVNFVSMDDYSSQLPGYNMPDATVDVMYEIEAQSVSIFRKSFGAANPVKPNMTLKDRDWHVLIGNYPVGDVELPQFDNKAVDAPFALYYDLAKQPVGIKDKMVPMFDIPPGKIGSSPECMPMRF